MVNPIIDLIIRIKNGYQAMRGEIGLPHSVYREKVLEKLKEIQYIKDYSVTGDTVKKIRVELLYNDAGVPALTGVKLYSKPGRRWYSSSSQLKSVLGGLGYSILSTPQGIMTHVEAKRKKVGGELLFSIW
ncbi:30S ribosomal protein S8 [Candidatus Roizmanbacteria bacterium]|nr:30S ribosomal protein S8 [Candidatus Roizmanbacteria bacterium]